LKYWFGVVGQTTITLQVIAEAQKTGGMAHSSMRNMRSIRLREKAGGGCGQPAGLQPDYGEQALEITETLVRSNAIDVLVVDSVRRWCPRPNSMGNGRQPHGLQARLMSQAFAAKLTGTVSKSRTCLIFIQSDSRKNWRDVRQSGTTTGGKALNFFLRSHRYPAHRCH